MLLEIQNISVSVLNDNGNNSIGNNSIPIVDDISFRLENGKVIAVVGESGSGKTTLCRSLTRLLPSSRFAVKGLARFESTDLLTCNETELRYIRQNKIRYIFQEPQQALNPVVSIRKQLRFASGATALSDADITKTLESVGLAQTGEVLKSYPHQLSIGMAQRVQIAMAILPKPSLLIADEPTSAVDASLRYQLLDLLTSIQKQNAMGMILITHDLEVARRYADDVAVLQRGRIVEHKDSREFFRNANHPYSRLLLDAVPSAMKRIKTESADLNVS